MANGSVFTDIIRYYHRIYIVNKKEAILSRKYNLRQPELVSGSYTD